MQFGIPRNRVVLALYVGGFLLAKGWAQSSAAAASTLYSSLGCVQSDVEYVDALGEEYNASYGDAASRCQQRCATTHGCGFFSFYPASEFQWLLNADTGAPHSTHWAFNATSSGTVEVRFATDGEAAHHSVSVTVSAMDASAVAWAATAPESRIVLSGATVTFQDQSSALDQGTATVGFSVTSGVEYRLAVSTQLDSASRDLAVALAYGNGGGAIDLIAAAGSRGGLCTLASADATARSFAGAVAGGANCTGVTAGASGVEACPTGFLPVVDGVACATYAPYIGFVYNASLNATEGIDASVCRWCGDCAYPSARVTTTASAGGEKWVCVEYQPTNAPTVAPTTSTPTVAPTAPTQAPTQAPTVPTNAPTAAPTLAPTPPTNAPTHAPTPPTSSPTTAPTNAPTPPTYAPTHAPSSSPTYATGIVVVSDAASGATLGPRKIVAHTETGAESCTEWYHLSLLGPPESGAVVTVAVHSESARLVLSPSVVNFTSSDWSAGVKVCVRAASDGVDRSDEGSKWLADDGADLDARRIIVWHSVSVTSGADAKYTAYGGTLGAPALSAEWSCYVGAGHGFRSSALASTAAGETCQDWSVDTPHSHPMILPHLLPGTGLGPHAYCRNPEAAVTPFPTPAPTTDTTYIRFYRFNVTATRAAANYRPVDADYPYMLAEFAIWRAGIRINLVSPPSQAFPIVTATVGGLAANETIDGDVATTITTSASDRWGNGAWDALVVDLGDDGPEADAYGWLCSSLSTTGSLPDAWVVDGSIDGVEWRRLSTVDAAADLGPEIAAPGEWQYVFINETWPTMSPTAAPTVAPTLPTSAPSMLPTERPTYASRRRLLTSAPTAAYGTERPWCYTTDAGVPWGYCDVSSCGDGAVAFAIANGGKAGLSFAGISSFDVLLESGACTTSGAANITGTVVLNTVPRHNVTVSLTGGSQLSFEPAVFVFGPHGAAQSFTVTAVADARNEAAAHSATITATAASSDAIYATATQSLALSVEECDVSALVVSPAVSVLVETSSIVVRVQLASVPLAPVFVAVVLPTLDGVTASAIEGGAQSAVAGCSAGGCTLEFGTSSADQYFDVHVAYADNPMYFGDQNVTVAFHSLSADLPYNDTSASSVVVLRDNDVAQIVLSNIGGSGLSVREPTVASGSCPQWWLCDGFSANYTVTLSTEPQANVSVAISGARQIAFLAPTASDAHATATAIVLVFTPLDWNVPRQVVVTGADDQVSEESWHYATLTHVAASVDV